MPTISDMRHGIVVYDADLGSLVLWDGSLNVGGVVIGTVTQGAPGASAWAVAQSRVAVTPASGSVSSQGNNTLITPSAGKRICVYYASYNPSAAVELGFRFGAAGTLWMRNNITTGGSIVSKDMGEFRTLAGAVDEPLILNLGGAVATIWNCFYTEID